MQGNLQKGIRDYEEGRKYELEKEMSAEEERKMVAIINRKKCMVSIYNDIGDRIDTYECEEIIIK